MSRVLSIDRTGWARQSYWGLWCALAFFSLFASSFSGVRAASEAVVVVGLAGAETDRDTLNSISDRVKAGLLQHGFKPDAITILQTETQGKSGRDTVLKALAGAGSRLQPTDELWLILLGHSGRTAEGSPSFQMRGPRLTAMDLQDALKKIKARQMIVIGTENSGAYLPFLKNERAMVISATDAEGETSQPRFPEKWAQALTENPTWTPVQIAARASQLVESEYESQSLALAENPKLYDPISGKILSAPFGVTDLSSGLATKPAPGGMTPVNPNDIEVPKEKARYHKEVATAETKAIIAEARKASNPEGHPALVLQEAADFTVNADLTTAEARQMRVFIVAEEAVEKWANYTFPNNPGLVGTKISAARVIQPDGTAYVMNIDKVCGTVEGVSGCPSCPVHLLLPEVHAGCVIDLAWRTEGQSPGALPFFYDELSMQHDIPVLRGEFSLKVPKKVKFNYRLKNNNTAPVVTETDTAKIVKWTFASGLPAYEPLPLDPPERDLITAVQVGSIQDWDEFITWYRRIAKDSDKIDKDVKILAKELARDHPSRADKIKAAFEYVSALRYVAIEFGIHGYRPRTPSEVLSNRYGDCKDKANLLSALLREMGIHASIALINRMSSTDADFPGWQFNHAIAYVPPAPDQGQKDGLWLDTTDTVTPFGFIAPGNVGRSALVLPAGETGGKFIKVVDPNRSLSFLQESWEWTQGTNGVWTGALKREWGGLADYEQRMRLKKLSPSQRQFVLRQDLSEETFALDFTELKLGDVADLATPVRLTARVSGSDLSLRPLGVPLMGLLSAPSRNRALVLNDGQPIAWLRKSRFVYAQPVAASERKEMKPISWTGGGMQLDFQQRWLDERTFEQVEKIDVATPIVASADYATVRSGLQQWLRQISAARPVKP